MKKAWAGSLSLSLGLLAASVQGADRDTYPVLSTSTPAGQTAWLAPAVGLGRPVVATTARPSTPPAPVAMLARPMPAGTPRSALPWAQTVMDRHVVAASFSPPGLAAPRVIRAQGSDEIKLVPEPAPTPRPAPSPSTPGGPTVLYDAEPDVGAHPPVAEGFNDGAFVGEGPYFGDTGTFGDGAYGGDGCCGDGCCGDGCCADGCCGQGCCGDGSCCNGCCDDVGPNVFWLRAEYLLWWIRNSQTPPLVTSSSNPADRGVIGAPTTTVLFGGSISNEERSGGRFSAGIWLDPCEVWGVEGSVFFLADRTIRFTASSPGIPLLARPFFDVVRGVENFESVANPTLTASGIFGPLPALTGMIRVGSSSRLFGAELNGTYNCYRADGWRVDLLAGARYLNLKEGIVITENLLVPPPSVIAGATFGITDSFGTLNNFYGGQVGAKGKYNWGNWDLELVGKVAFGVTSQIVDINGITITTGVPGVISPAPGGLLTGATTNIGHFSRNRFSVVPEANVNVGYQLTENWRVFVGYDFLFWSNVARPGDQINRNVNIARTGLGVSAGLPLTGPVQPSFAFRDTAFWAQGVDGGLEFRW